MRLPIAGDPPRHPTLSRRSARRVAPAAAWLVLATACASGAPQEPAARPESPPAAVAETSPAVDAPAATNTETPAPPAEAAATGIVPVEDNPLAAFGGEVVGAPGEQWHAEEDGRRFYLVEIERLPTYKILPNGFVMLPPGAAYPLVEAREDALVVKVYDTSSFPTVPPRPADAAAAELTAALDSVEVEVADTLRFERAATLARQGQWRQDFELVDIDGDGFLDIVHGPPRKGDGRPKIFLGDGQGGWRPWREARFVAPSLDYGDVAVADFDGDGALDLALAVHLRGLIVLRGDGRGRFERWGEDLPYWTPGSDTPIPEFSSRTIEAVDWNRDGRPDLLALGEGPRIVRESGSDSPDFSHGERGAILFLNRGAGRWERYDQGVDREQIFGDGLALGDFDGDGLTDFAIASRVSGASKFVKLGQADGSWRDESLGEAVRPGVYGAVLAADLDDDGREELVLGYALGGSGETTWTGIDVVDYRDGSWHRSPLIAVDQYFGGVTALAAGDLDADGRTDLVALTRTGDRWIFLATEQGGFRQEESPELAPSELLCQGYSAHVVRLEASGRTLLLMGFAGEPGSEQIFAPGQKRCPSQGSFEVWEPGRAE